MLNPENLGKVHVAVTAKQGIVTAQLTAQNEQVKAALENQMTALKEQFNNQGVKVEAVEITVDLNLNRILKAIIPIRRSRKRNLIESLI